MNPTRRDDGTGNDERAGEAFDRLLAAGLAEVLGAQQAPDVSARLATRLAPRPRRRRLPLAAAAALAAGVALFAVLARQPMWADVEVRVGAGRCAIGGRSDPVSLAAGEQRVIRLAVGDRITTDSGSPAALDLASLGRMDMQRSTELEVRSMTTMRFGNRVAAGVITFGVIGGGVVWYATSGGSQTAAHGQTLRVEAGTPVASPDALSTSALEAENRQLRERVAELEAAAHRQPTAEPREQPAPPPPAKDAAVALTARITDPRFLPALEAIDWRSFGESMQQMVPLMAKLAEEIEKGEMGPEFLELAGKLQQLNGKLVAQAKALVDHKVPGAGVNGAFTHPVIAANQVDAVLTIAGKPLAADQRLRLTELAQRYSAQDDALRASAASQTFQLEGVLSEVELKDRFYEDVASTLTPEQQQQLWSERTKGRNAFDLFGTGVVWAQFARVEDVADRADFAQRVNADLASRLGVSGAGADRLRAVVDAWSHTWPADAWSEKPDALAGAKQAGPLRAVKTSQIAGAAKRQLALLRDVLAKVPLSPEARQQLIESRRVMVPVRK